MREPCPERTADSSERGAVPDFDELTPPNELVRGERTRDDFFDTVLQLDTPATVEEVAELAGHGPDAAREYLGWFERLGIVTRVTESPATYELNRAYLVWRRVQRVQNTYDDDELVDLLGAETEREQAYAERFGAESPGTVSLTEYATETDRSIEETWEALSAWKTARRRIRILERAVAERTGDSSGYHRSVA